MAMEQRDLRRKEPVSYFPDPVLASLINGAKQLSAMTSSSSVVSSGRRNSHNSSNASLSSSGSVKVESQDTSNGRASSSSSSSSSSCCAGKAEEPVSVDSMRRNEPINRFKRKYAGQLLTVKCNDQTAQLDVDNLPEIVGSMTHAKRKCVLFANDWVTPTEYEALTGFGSRKNWRSSVRMQGRSIKQHIDALASESVAEDLENSCFSTPTSSSQQQYVHATSSSSTGAVRSASSGGGSSSSTGRSRNSSNSMSPVKDQQQRADSPVCIASPSDPSSFSDGHHLHRRVQTVAMPSSGYLPPDTGKYEPPFKLPYPVARISPPPPLASLSPQRPSASLSGQSPSRRSRSVGSSPHASAAPSGGGRRRSTSDGDPWCNGNGGGGSGGGHGKGSLENLSPPDLLPAHSVYRSPPSSSSSSSAAHGVRTRKPSSGSNKRKASPPVRVDYGNGMSEPLLCQNTTDSGMSITVTAVEDESEKRVLLCAQPTVHLDAGTPRCDLMDALLPLGHPFSWTSHQVGDFLRSKALYKAARKCEEEEIDGRAFLKLREDHFLNCFNMKLGPALNFVELVTQLNAYFCPTEKQRTV